MIERTHPKLSVGAQCRLLSISRSSFYYAPQGETAMNLDRLKSEASFAALCGVSPAPASSGKTVRHRLNRGGDRAANSAIHIIAIGRLRLDARTQDYMARRIAAGNSKLEAIRCLKRYIAREVFGIIMRRHREINQSQIAA